MLTLNIRARLDVLFLCAWASLVPATAFATGPELYKVISILNLPANRVYLLGGTMEFSCEITNTGGEATAAYDVVFYLKAAYGANNQMMGTVRRDPLSPGQIDKFSASLAVPAACAKNWHSVMVGTRCSNVDSYFDAEVAVVRLVASCPDLVLVGVDAADGVYGRGATLPVAVTVKNIGGVFSGPYTVTFSTEGHSLGGAQREGLGLDASETFETLCTLPDDMLYADYRVEAVVTPSSSDDNLANNKGYDASAVCVRAFPDLRVESVDLANGVYEPGGQIVICTVVENIGEKASDGYAIYYYASTDPTIGIRDYSIGYVSCEGLPLGGRHSYTTTCRLPPYLPAGACYIGVIVKCVSESNLQNNTGRDNETITVVHPQGYLCGQATYEDPSGWSHPIRYARVKIYVTDNNSDPTDDRVIGETSTDGEGNYGMPLATDAASGPEVYVRIFTEAVPGACPGTTSKICTVKDHVLKQLYSLRSINYPYPVTTSVMIPTSSPRTAGEFMVYDSIIEGFEKTREFFGLELGETPAYWPTSDGGTYYAPGEGIFVSKDDRGDRDVIMHEYGHFVADSSGFALGSVGEDPIHYWNLDLRIQPSNRTNQQARNLAFREAWATLFAVATQYGDASYPYAGDTKYQDVDEITRKALVVDLEAVTAARKSPGEYYECMNAGALWDIFDDTCDVADNNDTMSDLRLARIWATAMEAKPSDILDFWKAWFARFGDRREISRVFWDHGMTPKAPVSTPTIETFETGDFSALAWSLANPPWVVASEAGHQSTYAARSGKIGNSQSSSLEITMDCDDGWIYFWFKTSCEPSWDPLRFFVDGVKKEEWSGENDWKRVGYPVAGGKRKFTWTFNKDSGAAQGADAVWIDDIEFPRW